jgi:hypothetical protein
LQKEKENQIRRKINGIDEKEEKAGQQPMKNRKMAKCGRGDLGAKQEEEEGMGIICFVEWTREYMKWRGPVPA